MTISIATAILQGPTATLSVAYDTNIAVASTLSVNAEVTSCESFYVTSENGSSDMTVHSSDSVNVNSVSDVSVNSKIATNTLNTEEVVMKGRRIVDIQHFIDSLKLATAHSENFEKTMNDLNEYYDYIFNKSSDARTLTWPLITSPLPLLSILATYLYAIYIYLPNYMSDRKPYKLKTVLAVYNLFQVATCLILIYGISTSGWTTHYTLGCQEADFSNDKMSVQMAKYFWWTFMLKLVELSETVMFVLRKKSSQVTPLHVYHHVSTVIYVWLGVKYYPGGMATFSILLNSCVHVLMYTYYFLSSLGPVMQKKLEKVKSKITTIQIIQLVLLIIHALQILSPTCNIPNLMVYVFTPNIVINLILFLNFYKKSYSKEKTI
ncbi:hypothetical protein RN001_002196 [Aquatica leii]|uniref:Elongation of very long chain fatty acids protein n=1 Tax=Aquatica leii TaxID=1421715 RepID=A0AAN7PD30_9COLE|nr:hypothetical protein RN001_002196 [Aquatica leii]